MIFRLVLMVCLTVGISSDLGAAVSAQVETKPQAEELSAEEMKAKAKAEEAAREDEAVAQLDSWAQFQHQSVKQNASPVAHWGWRADSYTLWGTHSNRLIPVYTFGTKGAGLDIFWAPQ